MSRFELYEDVKRPEFFSDQDDSEGKKVENICSVIEKGFKKDFFQNHVTFALLEVLLIQTKGEGQAYTFFHCNKDSNSLKEYENDYFDIINDVFPQKNIPSISVLDDFYFEDMIWIGEICNKNSNQSCSLEKEWKHVPEPKELPKDYKPTGQGTKAKESLDYKELFGKYGTEIFKKFFCDSNYFYILLIPVALYDENHQEKIGAVFLHIGTNEEICQDTLLNVYQKVILYWHYNLTGGVLEKRQREIDEANAWSEQHQRERDMAEKRAMLFDQIRPSVEKLTALLHEANKPLSELTSVMSPMKQFIFAGTSLAPFFESGTATLGDFGYKDPSLVSFVVHTAHNFNKDQLEKFKDLIPSILLIALGEAGNARAPLWDYLRFYLSVPPESKKLLADGIKNTLPELQNDSASIEEKAIDNCFNTIKSWFNDTYKPKSYLSPKLLRLTAKILDINTIDIPEQLDHSSGIHVASSLPIDTIDALDSLHREYEIQSLKAETEGYFVTFTLKLRREHKMTQKDAEDLRDHLYPALAFGQGRGSTTSILCQIFSSLKREKRDTVEERLQLSCEKNNFEFKYSSESREQFSFTLKFFNQDEIAIKTKIT